MLVCPARKKNLSPEEGREIALTWCHPDSPSACANGLIGSCDNGALLRPSLLSFSAFGRRLAGPFRAWRGTGLTPAPDSLGLPGRVLVLVDVLWLLAGHYSPGVAER